MPTGPPTADHDAGAPSALDVTLAYHERSKHRPSRYAAALGYLDWETQPDPFRRFEGARLLPLDLIPLGPDPRDDAAFGAGRVVPSPLDRTSLSRLFQDSLAISAWKQAGAERWALRVNPSSGNLHPTEGYLVAGPVAGLHPRPAVFHYSPYEHGLELRTELSDRAWSSLAGQLPAHAALLGLTSIYWRESWKYGERAFRYCHHDCGHAIGCVAVAAAGLGWDTRLLESVTDRELATLLGVHTQTGVESEHADGLIAVFPQGAPFPPDAQRGFTLPGPVREELSVAAWTGAPNRLSPDHHAWPAIDAVAVATEKDAPPAEAFWSRGGAEGAPHEHEGSPAPLRQIVHTRRSAVAMDGRTGITRDAFYGMLGAVMPGTLHVPFATLPWRPCVDLLLFVHRVADVSPGLYVLVRDPTRRAMLADLLDPDAAWVPPPACPEWLPLFMLKEGDARRLARHTSCDQAIASDGVFAVAMLAEYRETLERFGPWHYRRLHWESGLIGQMLYLEAEAAGIRGTGIGCFFDDLTHRAFGLRGDRLQVLYHFAMGAPVEDARLRTHPPYQHLTRTRHMSAD